jgi:hypothetical protein
VSFCFRFTTENVLQFRNSALHNTFLTVPLNFQPSSEQLSIAHAAVNVLTILPRYCCLLFTSKDPGNDLATLRACDFHSCVQRITSQLPIIPAMSYRPDPDSSRMRVTPTVMMCMMMMMMADSQEALISPPFASFAISCGVSESRHLCCLLRIILWLF